MPATQAQPATILSVLSRSPRAERERVAQYQARSESFTYRFEELSLPPSDIAEIMGPISGHADIHYFEDEDGGWSIGEIRVDPLHSFNSVWLDRSSWLYHAIYDALENEASWNADICDAVRNKIEG